MFPDWPYTVDLHIHDFALKMVKVRCPERRLHTPDVPRVGVTFWVAGPRFLGPEQVDLQI